MAPKGGNAKKEAGRARKAENEEKKKQLAAAEKAKKEAAKWEEGAKGKNAKEEKEAKRREALEKKAERERLLAEEETATASKPKAAPKAGPKAASKAGAKKKAAATPRPAGPGAIAAGGGLTTVEAKTEPAEEIESFSASNIDDAIAMMEVVTAKKNKASMGQAAAGLERHPERRFKAAFESYQERELPNIKEEYPGLRLNQYKELLFKQFQKSPENPFNQTVLSYNATKEEEVEALEKRNREIEERLRDRTKNLSLED